MDSELDVDIVVVIKRLAKSISKHGVKKVVAILDQLNTEDEFIEAHRQLIKFIMNGVCNSFNIHVSETKKSNPRGKIADARSICFLLIKKHIDLKHKDIANLFGRKNHTLVSHAIKKFNNLDYSIKQDRFFLDIHNEWDEKVENKKALIFDKYKNQ